ncbi:MAG: hypothetical protein ACREQ8_18050 [Woeseiaceae bacterium]
MQLRQGSLVLFNDSGAFEPGVRQSRPGAVAVLIAASALACTLLSACREPAVTLATALAAKDRKAVQAEIDPVLAAQDPAAPVRERMEALRQWIEDQEGILHAELNPDLLDTEPPVQQVRVALTDDPQTIHTIGIVLDPTHLRFNRR